MKDKEHHGLENSPEVHGEAPQPQLPTFGISFRQQTPGDPRIAVGVSLNDAIIEELKQREAIHPFLRVECQRRDVGESEREYSFSETVPLHEGIVHLVVEVGGSYELTAEIVWPQDDKIELSWGKARTSRMKKYPGLVTIADQVTVKVDQYENRPPQWLWSLVHDFFALAESRNTCEFKQRLMLFVPLFLLLCLPLRTIYGVVVVVVRAAVGLRSNIKPLFHPLSERVDEVSDDWGDGYRAQFVRSNSKCEERRYLDHAPSILFLTPMWNLVASWVLAIVLYVGAWIFSMVPIKAIRTIHPNGLVEFLLPAVFLLAIICGAWYCCIWFKNWYDQYAAWRKGKEIERLTPAIWYAQQRDRYFADKLQPLAGILPATTLAGLPSSSLTSRALFEEAKANVCRPYKPS
ncbi:MAG: hypothetical protein NT003_03345 [Candidatus Magasanikbacteria bacterium]|nr:hypothetical protein [Candidatus Magasanikbacteria bacterium]